MNDPRSRWQFGNEPLRDLLSVLGPLLDEAPHELEMHEGRAEVRFPSPPGADYHFAVSLYSDGEASLGAQLVSDPDAYFWYAALESPDFPSREALAAELVYLVRTSLSHSSRIVHERGAFFHSFKAEVLIAEEWEVLPGGGAALRAGGFAFPELEGDTKVYHSPALLR